MKVIIDISEDLYNRIFDGEIALNTDDKWELEESVRLSIMHGKVLPKTHGRLIDADSLKNTLDYYIQEAGWSKEHNESLGWCKDEFIDSEPTIIEAEKGDKE